MRLQSKSKPDVPSAFSKGELVKFKGRDGRETVAEIQGTFQASPTSGKRLMGTSPNRGTMEVRQDEKSIKKIDLAEFNKIAANNALHDIGFAEGSNILCEIGGEMVNTTLEEVGGSVFDEAKEHVYVKTANGIQKIRVGAIKKAALKKLGAGNIRFLLRAMAKFTKLGAVIGSLGGGVVGATIVEVMAPSDVSCAEIVTILYTDLEPNWSRSSSTTLTDYFKTLTATEQRAMLRGSTHICEALKEYMKSKTPNGKNFDYQYSQLECSSTTISFQSHTTLFPPHLAPGAPEGYKYEVRSEPGSKRVSITAKPHSSCRNTEVCANPPSESAVRIFMTGSEVSTMSLNGTLVTAQSNSALYRSMLEQAYNFHRQSQVLRNECVRNKNGETGSNTTTQ